MAARGYGWSILFKPVQPQLLVGSLGIETLALENAIALRREFVTLEGKVIRDHDPLIDAAKAPLDVVIARKIGEVTNLVDAEQALRDVQDELAQKRLEASQKEGVVRDLTQRLIDQTGEMEEYLDITDAVPLILRTGVRQSVLDYEVQLVQSEATLRDQTKDLNTYRAESKKYGRAKTERAALEQTKIEIESRLVISNPFLHTTRNAYIVSKPTDLNAGADWDAVQAENTADAANLAILDDPAGGAGSILEKTEEMAASAAVAGGLVGGLVKGAIALLQQRIQDTTNQVTIWTQAIVTANATLDTRIQELEGILQNPSAGIAFNLPLDTAGNNERDDFLVLHQQELDALKDERDNLIPQQIIREQQARDVARDVVTQTDLEIANEQGVYDLAIAAKKVDNDALLATWIERMGLQMMDLTRLNTYLDQLRNSTPYKSSVPSLRTAEELLAIIERPPSYFSPLGGFYLMLQRSEMTGGPIDRTEEEARYVALRDKIRQAGPTNYYMFLAGFDIPPEWLAWIMKMNYFIITPDSMPPLGTELNTFYQLLMRTQADPAMANVQ